MYVVVVDVAAVYPLKNSILNILQDVFGNSRLEKCEKNRRKLAEDAEYLKNMAEYKSNLTRHKNLTVMYTSPPKFSKPL
jgi:hypothetical protein